MLQSVVDRTAEVTGPFQSLETSHHPLGFSIKKFRKVASVKLILSVAQGCCRGRVLIDIGCIFAEQEYWERDGIHHVLDGLERHVRTPLLTLAGILTRSTVRRLLYGGPYPLATKSAPPL